MQSNRLGPFPRSLIALAALLAVSCHSDSYAKTPRQPNVLLIITDDQGYGDIGFHGNTMIRTPNLDALARQSVRLTNFHVDPTCAETRSALMTGKYSCRVGVWHTVMGRSILRRDEQTMADVFAKNGYQTGMFGKWHLGDNWPYRPHDRGFQEALYHGGGGVGQTPDFWGNDYFDDTYFRRGVPEPQSGYCTDVWFREATRFIEQSKDRPFFCYVATNAPHGPYNIDKKYSQPYAENGVPSPMAQFYGMIENVDENVGRLLQRLDQLNLAGDTIVIFMTDNGSAEGIVRGKPDPQLMWTGFNAGMRDLKGSQYDGGHRVPCWIRWPAGGLSVNQDVDKLTAHFDLLPSLIDFCGLEAPADRNSDGRSLRPILTGQHDWPERTLVVHSQRIDRPEMWRKCSVMTQRWRLVDGKELYDIQSDPGQQGNIASENQAVISQLREFYEKWWSDVSDRFDEYVRIPLGADEANPTTLNCMDWHAPISKIPWSQSNIAGNVDAEANGFWAVDVVRDGRYEFTLRSRPAGVSYRLSDGEASLTIGDVSATSRITPGSDSAKISVELKTGPAMLQTSVKESGRGERGAFFVEVRRIAPR